MPERTPPARPATIPLTGPAPAAAVPVTMASTAPYVSASLRLAAAWSWRALLVVAALGAVGWLLSTVAVIVLPLLIAVLIAALLAPPTAFLQRHGWPRAAAAAVTFLGLLVLILGLLVLVGQQLVAGFGDLSGQVITGFRTVSFWLQHNPLGIDSTRIAHVIDEAIAGAGPWLQDRSGSILGGVAGAATSVGEVLTGTILTLFAAFFLLYDGQRIFSWFAGLLPHPARSRALRAGLAGWQTLVQYVRVQIIVAAGDAIGIGIGAYLIGVPLAVPLTVLVFFGSFVPIIGAIVTGLIAVLVALVSQGLGAALIMLGVVILVHQLEGNVLQPFIMGRAVAIHPLAVVLAVTGGAALFGIAGALFAVPCVSVLNSIVIDLHRPGAGDGRDSLNDGRDGPAYGHGSPVDGQGSPAAAHDSAAKG